MAPPPPYESLSFFEASFPNMPPLSPLVPKPPFPPNFSVPLDSPIAPPWSPLHPLQSWTLLMRRCHLRCIPALMTPPLPLVTPPPPWTVSGGGRRCLASHFLCLHLPPYVVLLSWSLLGPSGWVLHYPPSMLPYLPPPKDSLSRIPPYRYTKFVVPPHVP